ncbi:MAG: C4-dicarboxylate ABC transporter permease [Lentisphaerae bacterium]|nr:C4-dicarboxylate ABC transporter permease [Lentisphaerota bacterium]
MIEVLRESAGLVASLDVGLCLLLGTLVGMVIGAIPGLTATMGVALLTPLTFDLEIMPALALLVGVYCGAIYGGSITAILFRTPGTPASAATLFDGHPMMRCGEAGRALSIAAWSAAAGGIIGTLLLVFLTPQISRFALSFGPAEFFAMAVFGLSTIVALSGESLLKGAVAAVGGLLLATVGMDPVSGYPRFILGQASLMEGVPFIPALIGLFAVAEVFCARGGGTAGAGAAAEGNLRVPVFPPAADARRCGWTAVRSSLLGTVVGAAPGAGCDIAAFLAYSVARQRARAGERFGEGEAKGIAAPEAAKSGAISGAMIPLLSLGIPGDSVTAILVGAFVLHGVQPGPLLFREHAPLAYAILGIVMLGHVAVLVCSLFTARLMTRALKADPRFVAAGILALSMLGAYAIRGQAADMAVAFAFGLLGVAMRRGGYPAAPLLLAMILGGMAEENFRRMLIVSSGSAAFLFTRPIAAAMLLVSAASVVAGLLRGRARG